VNGDCVVRTPTCDLVVLSRPTEARPRPRSASRTVPSAVMSTINKTEVRCDRREEDDLRLRTVFLFQIPMEHNGLGVEQGMAIRESCNQLCGESLYILFQRVPAQDAISSMLTTNGGNGGSPELL
jgi:hypothetical protein